MHALCTLLRNFFVVLRLFTIDNKSFLAFNDQRFQLVCNQKFIWGAAFSTLHGKIVVDYLNQGRIKQIIFFLACVRPKTSDQSYCVIQRPITDPTRPEIPFRYNIHRRGLIWWSSPGPDQHSKMSLVPGLGNWRGGANKLGLFDRHHSRVPVSLVKILINCDRPAEFLVCRSVIPVLVGLKSPVYYR